MCQIWHIGNKAVDPSADLHEGMSGDPTETFQEGKENFPNLDVSVLGRKTNSPNLEFSSADGETAEIESFTNLETCPRRS